MGIRDGLLISLICSNNSLFCYIFTSYTIPKILVQNFIITLIFFFYFFIGYLQSLKANIDTFYFLFKILLILILINIIFSKFLDIKVLIFLIMYLLVNFLILNF